MAKVSLFFTGDIVLKNGPTLDLDNNLKKDIAEADLALANFEGPETSSKIPLPKAGPSLKQSLGSIKFLKNLGFGYLSLANNHIMDYGQRGVDDTLRICLKNDISNSGAGSNIQEAVRAQSVELNGQKISIISCAEKEFGYTLGNEPGYSPLFASQIDDEIIKEAEKGNFVIVIVHGGIEECPFPTIKTRERYHQLIDKGARLVIGSHPHVPQGYEKWGDGLIFYSLGDFCVGFSYSNFGDDQFRWGLTLRVSISNNKITNFKLKPVINQNGLIKYIETKEIKKIDRFLNFLSKIFLTSGEFEQMYQIQNKKMFDDRYLNFINQIFVPPAIAVLAKKLKPFQRSKKYLSSDKLLLLSLMMINESHSFVITEGLKEKMANSKKIINHKKVSLYNYFFEGVNYYSKIKQ